MRERTGSVRGTSSQIPVRASNTDETVTVCGSDDFQLRVYNYNTGAREAAFEAHPDYIRAVVVHPTQPYVLTASDDMTIKLWDWDNNWRCKQIYEGHAHYVMSIAINPKDPATFASACLDRTVKIWSLEGPCRMTIDAHEQKGVNHVDYYGASDKPYILTTSDDRTIKIWDYTTKSLIQTLEGHTSNVSFAVWHPELPVIISGSEDGTVKIWNSQTYRLEQSLSYGLERAWCVSYQRGKQGISIGFDDGSVVISMGREQPAVSMDASGKIIWAKHSEIKTAVIKPEKALKDGERLTLPSKDLGHTEIYPSTLQHSPNGRFVAVAGDGEYIVYTALALRNQAFGAAQAFVWSADPKDSAILESATSIKIQRNFKPRLSPDVGFSADGLAGGVLLGVKGAGGIGFFNWETGQLVRRIEVDPTNVYWADSGELVALCCNGTFYVLRYSSEAYAAAVQSGEVEEDGVEAAFEVVTDINETVRTGQWVGDSFLYTNDTNRLNYLVGTETYVITTFDQPMYILGYLQRDARIYLCDKEINVVSYSLSLSVVEFQTLVLRGDLDSANALLPDIPDNEKNKLARFLEGQGYKEEALDLSKDPEHRFDLSLGLNRLDIALDLAKEAESEHKWKTVGDAALTAWDIALAETCFENAKDLGSLLLLRSASNDQEGLAKLAQQAQDAALNNVAFSCLWLQGDLQGCIDLLVKTNRVSEAVMFAQTYRPSRVPGLVKEWKKSLEVQGKTKVARLLGMPPSEEGEGDAEMFPEWDEYLRLEKEGGASTTLIELDDEKADGINGANGTEAEEQEDGEPEPVETEA